MKPQALACGFLYLGARSRRPLAASLPRSTGLPPRCGGVARGVWGVFLAPLSLLLRYLVTGRLCGDGSRGESVGHAP